MLRTLHALREKAMAQPTEEAMMAEPEEHPSVRVSTYNKAEHYDSYAAYRQLRDGGMSRSAAEAVLSSQFSLIETHLPIKEDIRNLDRRVENLERNVGHLQDSVAALPQLMETMVKNSQLEMEAKMAAGNLFTLKWTFGMLFTMTAVLVAVLKLFPG